MPRPDTQPTEYIDENGNRWERRTFKRCCNGCDQEIGDATDQEIEAGFGGRQMPDVRGECPVCSPAAAPACTAITLYAGPSDCLDHDCDEYAAEDGEPTDIDHCSHVVEEQVCETHSEFYDGEVCTHAEPWPCQAASRPSGDR